MARVSDADSRICAFLELVDEYISLQEAVQLGIRGGWGCLAEAKYALMPAPLGAAGVPSQIEARTWIRADDGDFAVARIPPGDPATAPAAERTSSAQSKRPGDGQDASSSDDESVTEMIRAVAVEERERGASAAPVPGGSEKRRRDARQRSARADPIRWHGSMVPPSLRAAQRRFGDVVDSVARLATCRARLLAAWRALHGNANGAASTGAGCGALAAPVGSGASTS